MYVCRMPQQKEFLLQALKSIENPTISTNQGENLTPTDLRNKPTMNAYSEDKKGKPFVPPFLLILKSSTKPSIIVWLTHKHPPMLFHCPFAKT